MGRIVDLFAEVAAAIEEGPEGLVLPNEDRERLGADWPDADIEDAIALVRDNLLQGELLDCADSLSVRLIDLLGAFGEEAAFRTAQDGQAVVSLEVIGQLARRVDRLEEVLEVFRDGTPPDRRAFDVLRQRLADAGIEADMRDEWPGMNDDEDEESDD
jgi:hypothetical protein